VLTSINIIFLFDGFPDPQDSRHHHYKSQSFLAASFSNCLLSTAASGGVHARPGPQTAGINPAARCGIVNATEELTADEPGNVAAVPFFGLEMIW